MSRHDDSVSLRQMLDHAREAVVMAQPHTRVDLNSNRMLTLALIQLVADCWRGGKSRLKS